MHLSMYFAAAAAPALASALLEGNATSRSLQQAASYVCSGNEEFCNAPLVLFNDESQCWGKYDYKGAHAGPYDPAVNPGAEVPNAGDSVYRGDCDAPGVWKWALTSEGGLYEMESGLCLAFPSSNVAFVEPGEGGANCETFLFEDLGLADAEGSTIRRVSVPAAHGYPPDMCLAQRRDEQGGDVMIRPDEWDLGTCLEHRDAEVSRCEAPHACMLVKVGDEIASPSPSPPAAFEYCGANGEGDIASKCGGFPCVDLTANDRDNLHLMWLTGDLTAEIRMWYAETHRDRGYLVQSIHDLWHCQPAFAGSTNGIVGVWDCGTFYGGNPVTITADFADDFLTNGREDTTVDVCCETSDTEACWASTALPTPAPPAPSPPTPAPPTFEPTAFPTSAPTSSPTFVPTASPTPAPAAFRPSYHTVRDQGMDCAFFGEENLSVEECEENAPAMFEHLTGEDIEEAYSVDGSEWWWGETSQHNLPEGCAITVDHAKKERRGKTAFNTYPSRGVKRNLKGRVLVCASREPGCNE